MTTTTQDPDIVDCLAETQLTGRRNKARLLELSRMVWPADLLVRRSRCRIIWSTYWPVSLLDERSSEPAWIQYTRQELY